MTKEGIHEVFAALGQVTVRRMFGGWGVYCEGVIIAIEYQGDLLLKADPVSAPEFAAAGASQWTYDGQRSAVLMPYWSIPDAAFDDPDLMAHWVRLALQAGLRAGTGRASPTRRKGRTS